MKLGEAIKHLEENLADQSHDWGCEECKGEHEQLLEWLRELKELRILVAGDNTPSIQELEIILAMLRAQNNDNDIALCELCEKAVKLQDREVKLKEAKRLLKTAVEDMNDSEICYDIDTNTYKVCTQADKFSCDTFKWRYTAEALKLIGEED